MNRYVLGDLHGCYKALMQVFQQANFNYQEDLLVSLGDVADGYLQVYECFEELTKIKNLIYIMGNHDEWFLNWVLHGEQESIWTTQGGKATITSYIKRENVPTRHISLLKSAHTAFELNGEKRIFVHGGIDVNQKNMQKQNADFCLWDRDLVKSAWINHFQHQDYKYGGWEEIYVGHTTTELFVNTSKRQQKYQHCYPLKLCNVWMMDTGAGWSGKLSMMNIDNKEVFQSDYVGELYPGYSPRGY